MRSTRYSRVMAPNFQVRWTRRALTNLDGIVQFIAKDNDIKVIFPASFADAKPVFPVPA